MLVEIRCQSDVIRWKDWVTCNHLCARASPYSQIELRCRYCKSIFRAVVNEDGFVTYIEEPPEGFEQ